MSDPRLCLVRGDLAAAELEGLWPAARYKRTTPMRVSAPTAALRSAPDSQAEQASQLLFGESFNVLLEEKDYAFGQVDRDGYVGFVGKDALSIGRGSPEHRVRALRTFAFSEPSIKSSPVGAYSLNALVTPIETEGRFVRAADSGWFISDHLAKISDFDDDPVEVAERFLGVPYLWGGNDSLGLDCSGLVQQALRACGKACPRDSDQQMAIGDPIAELETLQRGDLIFWKGHVGFIVGPNRLLHANAHHMAVAIEALDAAIHRIVAAGSGRPIAFRRPSA